MDEPNYTETNEDGTGFTKRIRTNKISSPDGAPPLSIIEFSFTKETRGKLESLLKPYVDGEREDAAGLKAIFENPDNFPKEVLEELKKLSRENGAPSTVYVIHNLPEHEIEVMENMLDNSKSINKPAYADYVSDGVGLALGLCVGRRASLIRQSGDDIIGDELHKHSEEITALNGVYLNPETPIKTRFTDMGALIENIRIGKETSPLVKGIGDQVYSIEHDPVYTTDYKLPSDHGFHVLDERMVQKYSQEVLLGAGSMAIWSNRGGIFHQALPYHGTTKEKIQRLVLSTEFHTPERYIR